MIEASVLMTHSVGRRAKGEAHSSADDKSYERSEHPRLRVPLRPLRSTPYERSEHPRQSPIRLLPTKIHAPNKYLYPPSGV